MFTNENALAAVDVEVNVANEPVVIELVAHACPTPVVSELFVNVQNVSVLLPLVNVFTSASSNDRDKDAVGLVIADHADELEPDASQVRTPLPATSVKTVPAAPTVGCRD